MKVLLTGSNGFVGKNMKTACEDWDVTCLTREDHDLSVPINLETKFDLIIHVAANASSKWCIENPRGCFNDNILATFNILEYARITGVPKVIYFSSCEVYEDRTGDASETDTVTSRNMYAASKIASENLCEAYSRSYGIKCIVIRLLNTWGPGVQPERFPAIIQRRFATEECPHFVLETKTRKRWLNIQVMAERVVKLTNTNLSDFEIFNFVGDENLMLHEFISKFGSNFTYEYVEKEHARGYAPEMNASGAKLYNILK